MSVIAKRLSRTPTNGAADTKSWCSSQRCWDASIAGVQCSRFNSSSLTESHSRRTVATVNLELIQADHIDPRLHPGCSSPISSTMVQSCATMMPSITRPCSHAILRHAVTAVEEIEVRVSWTQDRRTCFYLYSQGGFDSSPNSSASAATQGGSPLAAHLF